MSNEKLKIELKINTIRQELDMMRDSLDLLARELKAIEEEAHEMIEVSALPHYINMRKLEIQAKMEAAQ